MNRRDFLSLASATAGYTVLVRADNLAAAPEDGSRAFDAIAPAAPPAARFAGEPHMILVDLACDVFVAGGGMSGVCAAISAARHGAKVILAQDRSRLGGNASSEVRMHIVGADCSGKRLGWREGGLIEELRLDDAAQNPHRCFELWDLLLYDKVRSEPNATLLLDATLFAAETKGGEIQRVMVRCDKTEHLYRIRAKVYLDCTGDSRLALEAGAELRWGREAKGEFNESLALDTADRQTQGSSILFTARDYGKPVPFTPPPWARKVTREQLKLRPIRSWEYGYWWIEWGGQLNTIRDNERIRFELLRIVMGVWDYIKNSGDKPDSANWGMDWVGMIPGKRESRRIMGDHILTQRDLTEEDVRFEDAVCMGGWPLDDHPPSGFDRSDEKPGIQIYPRQPYNIPLRSLYSRNVRNLMMAGRNISASHVAFSSTRVMSTCAVMGQAAGTAAALCTRAGLVPRQLAQDNARLAELQQVLLRDDQTIVGARNADPKDLARQAAVSASDELPGAEARHVLDGWVRDLPKRTEHVWAARMSENGAWIELTWPQPQKLRHIQITFDTGFQRLLRLTAQASYSTRIIRGPQPETVRDYELHWTDAAGRTRSLAKVAGNYQRLNRHEFTPVEAKAVRLHITATNGADTARVYEIRCYA
ncbi:MAG TPA: FAD-dependent oxidoreductase [Candidatus Paceibacterota bacterium]|nr:FAD-dependent oxidoreductase [Verrucomicrobiota bacterium]HSA09380.1 FAD-dependent oxidoreductase [Candidatus Paceibacterota bacterium]